MNKRILIIMALFIWSGLCYNGSKMLNDCNKEDMANRNQYDIDS
jgi:hypothetical protein